MDSSITMYAESFSYGVRSSSTDMIHRVKYIITHPWFSPPPHPSHPTTGFGSIISQDIGAVFHLENAHLQSISFAELTGSKRIFLCHFIRIRPGVRIQCSIDLYTRVFYRSRIRIRAASIHTYIHTYIRSTYICRYVTVPPSTWPARRLHMKHHRLINTPLYPTWSVRIAYRWPGYSYYVQYVLCAGVLLHVRSDMPGAA